jgi:hypothetical protein
VGNIVVLEVVIAKRGGWFGSWVDLGGCNLGMVSGCNVDRGCWSYISAGREGIHRIKAWLI